MDHEGLRLADLVSGSSVAPDRHSYDKKTKKLEAAPPAITPFPIAGGEAVQTVPAVAAGEEGTFLVVWQEQNEDGNSLIMARVVRVQ